MKKKFLLLAFVVLTFSCMAQKPFQGFFKPVPDNLFSQEVKTQRGITGPSAWFFRPTVSLTATQFLLSKPVEVTSLNSFGMGMSYCKFTEVDGQSYMNFGLNALLLFTEKLGEVEPFKLSMAVTVTALQYVSVGAGYSFETKKPFILTGVVYNFN